MGGNWFGKGTDLLDQAATDATGLAQGSVDRTGLGAVDPGRDVGGIGIAVAQETLAGSRFVNKCKPAE
jgi:hypothetical protein